MADQFGDILDKAADEDLEPKPIPEGHWTMRCLNAKLAPCTIEKVNAEHQVNFLYATAEPSDDVDVIALDEFGDPEGRRASHKIFINGEEDWYEVKKFAELHGVETSGRTRREYLEAMSGAIVEARVEHYYSEAKEKYYPNLKDFAALD